MRNTLTLEEEHEVLKASAIFRIAANFFAEAADMMLKGASFRDPEVQRMVTAGKLKLAELPDRRH